MPRWRNKMYLFIYLFKFNGVRDGRSHWLVEPPTLYRAVPPELLVLHGAMRATNHKTCSNQWGSNGPPSECQPNALPVRPLRVFGHSATYWYSIFTLKINARGLFRLFKIVMHVKRELVDITSGILIKYIVYIKLAHSNHVLVASCIGDLTIANRVYPCTLLSSEHTLY